MLEISKIDQNINIKKIDNETVNVIITDNEMLMCIVGQFDQNLKSLSKLTNTDVYFRGNSITCKGEKEKLLSMVDDFFNPETRELYLSFGMPYKHIIMLYGVPGSGKTSTITAIASHFDCDIYTIPITKELK